MEIRPISLEDANRYVISHHRHHSKVLRHKFSLSAYKGCEMVGVAIVGRPVSRYLDDGMTLEVLRLCTDGCKNACSFLYSACARVAKEMGYKKIVTYILASESGKSLDAANWVCEKDDIKARSWDTPSRPRMVIIPTLFGDVQKYPIADKKRYCKILKV